MTTEATRVKKGKRSFVDQFHADVRVSSEWNALVIAALLLQKEQYRQTLDAMTTSHPEMTETESEKEDRVTIIELRDRFQGAQQVFHQRCEELSLYAPKLSLDEICSFYK